MIIKYIVTGSLLVALGAMGAILIASLVVPGSAMGTETLDARDDLVVVDSSGNEIEGAKIIEKEDGTTALVDEDGEEIKDAEVKHEEPADKDDSTVRQDSSNSPTKPSAGSGSTPAPKPDPGSPTPAPSPKPTPPPSNPAPKPTQPSPPPPPPPACGSGGDCTAAQVATHNSPSNCWVIYSGKVYNVTAFVTRHEGGRAVFNSNTCGRDIGIYLNGQREPVSGERYNHSSSNIREINSYYIAELS